VLCDLGIAVELVAGAPAASEDAEGTPQYMAPEQLDSAAPGVTAKADVWAAGAALLEMLGAPPFKDKTIGEIQDALVRPPARYARYAPHRLLLGSA
jgi:serine/threonine protein kinase